MNRIIAGRFPTKGEADIAAASLDLFIDASDICIFHNNPPGQHDTNEGGGDEPVDPQAEGAAESSVGTAAVAGVTAGAIGTAVGGPVIGLAAGATAAYVGSLAGALGGLKDKMFPNETPQRQPTNIYMAIHITNLANEDRVIRALRAHGAADIERADGEWRDGDWTDFDPVASPQLVPTERAPQFEKSG